MKKVPLGSVDEPGLYMLRHRRMDWNYVGDAVVRKLWFMRR